MGLTSSHPLNYVKRDPEINYDAVSSLDARTIDYGIISLQLL